MAQYEAGRYIERFKKRFPEIEDYRQRTLAAVRAFDAVAVHRHAQAVPRSGASEQRPTPRTLGPGPPLHFERTCRRGREDEGADR